MSGQIGFLFTVDAGQPRSSGLVSDVAPASAINSTEFYCRCETRVEESLDAIGSTRGGASVRKFYCPTCKRYLGYQELFQRPK